jgi:hypothetical protein
LVLHILRVLIEWNPFHTSGLSEEVGRAFDWVATDHVKIAVYFWGLKLAFPLLGDASGAWVERCFKIILELGAPSIFRLGAATPVFPVLGPNPWSSSWHGTCPSRGYNLFKIEVDTFIGVPGSPSYNWTRKY